MGSRKNGYHKVVGHGGRKFQGFVHSGDCHAGKVSQIEPLTTDLDKINAGVQSLKIWGDTYLPAGLIWGWRTLDSSVPFDEVAGKKKGGQKLLLLMTDGANTASLNGEKSDFNGLYHFGHSGQPDKTTEEADELTAELCNLIKQDGVRVISVAFEVAEASTMSLLRGCASSPSDFYDADSGPALKKAFSDIADSLNSVRLIR